jgi:hypothetical protein
LAQVPQLSATDAAVIVSVAAPEYLLAERASARLQCNIDRAQIFDWKLETWIGGAVRPTFVSPPALFSSVRHVNKLSTWTHRW